MGQIPRTSSTEGLGLMGLMAADGLAVVGPAVTRHVRNDRCASLAGATFPTS